MTIPQINFLKKYGVLVAVMVLLVVVINHLTLPSFKKIKNLSQQIITERKKMEEFYQKGQNLKKSKKEYQNIKDELNILDQIFIQPGHELDFITQLEDIAELNNIIQNINVGTQAVVREQQLKKMPVTIKLQGNLPNILNYLKSVEMLNFYFNIQSLSFSKNQDNNFLNTGKNRQPIQPLPSLSSQSLINVELDGHVYYYLEENKSNK